MPSLRDQVEQMADVSPDAYWKLISMMREKHQTGPLRGQAKYSKKTIRKTAAWMLEATNEKQASKNREAIAI